MALLDDSKASKVEIPDPPNKLKCSNNYCDTTESNYQDEEDDLLVCTNHLCKKKHIVMCRACMRASHKRSDHELGKKTKYFLFYKGWLSINENIADTTMTKVAKSVGKNAIKVGVGTVGAYAITDPKVWNMMKALPQHASKEQLRTYFEVLAGGQFTVNVAMFVVESGCHLVKYKYYGSISSDEFVRRVQKSGCANGVSFVTGCVGGGIGSLFGPWGAAIGLTVGGMIGDYATRSAFDSKNANVNEEFLAKAIRRFGYGDKKLGDLLNDENSFNIKVLEKRYHHYSRFHHPQGSVLKKNNLMTDREKEEKWMEYFSMYNALLTILKEKNVKKQKSQKKVQ